MPPARPLLPPRQVQTLAEREAALAAAEQTTRQAAEVLEGRKRQTQEIVIQAALQEGQQASALPACTHALPIRLPGLGAWPLQRLLQRHPQSMPAPQFTTPALHPLPPPALPVLPVLPAPP